MPQGVYMASQGFIADQTQLLQVVLDGLAVYNRTTTPLISRLSNDEVRQEFRIAQAPIPFEIAGDGANTLNQQQSWRKLTVPMVSYHTGVGWTIDGLDDSLPSDITDTLNGVMAGDVERQEAELFKAIFTKRTAGSVASGTAYHASWWNGETDVPNYKDSTFFGLAHSHFKGTGSVTLDLEDLDEAAIDIRQHGYGQRGLWAYFNIAQETALKSLLNITVASSLNTPQRTRAQDQGIHEGITYAGIDIFFDSNVPAGYFSVFDPFVIPLRRRVHPNPNARGLRMFGETFNENYPLAGKNFRSRFGFGVVHLGAGVARQLVASATYTNPTFRIQ